jgi:gamma-glutamyltranspeptidase/glutathione hydrolase
MSTCSVVSLSSDTAMIPPTIVSLFVLLTAIPSMAADRITGKPFATRSEIVARHGMAATSQPLATQVALDILKAGGSAVDAAIAANAMQALTEPISCGIGGDLFAIVWDGDSQKLHGLNASGRSPKSLKRDHFVELGITTIPPYGPLPISVPGCIDGWAELHAKFGKLPLADVLAPAIRYAREGFPVSELIAFYWNSATSEQKAARGFAETFLPGGKAPRKGEIFKNPGLADTLEKVAQGGRDAFYRGDVAKIIGDSVGKAGGFLTAADLEAHTSEWVEPVSENYRGYDIWELPPNGQGIAALQILQVLKGYDVRGFGYGSTDHIHHFVEAKKLAFEDRAKFYADPAFNKLPVAELISDAYADMRRKLIDPNKAATAYDAGNPALEHGDTIYLTVADKERNMVSLIQSNYRGFGSGVCPDGLGFSLQDRGQLFTLEEGHFNSYEPGKRPFHTIIPAFITRDGKPYVSFGVMGGATQPQGHAQIVMNLVDFDMNLQEAGDAPRILHSGSSDPMGSVMADGGYVSLESGFDREAVRELVKRRHSVREAVGPFGGYQAILYDAENDVYYGASESRKDGQAAGY